MFVFILHMHPFIILAAGNSSRMGQPKPFVKLNNRLTLLENLVVELKNCNIKQIVAVLNNQGNQILETHYSYLKQAIEIVINPYPEKGRLFSLKTGITKTGITPLFVQNVDNPFIHKELIDGMSNLLTKSAFVVPEYQHKGGHPVLISAEIVDDMLNKSLHTDNLRTFLSHYKKITYACTFQEILLNLNQPSDIEVFKKKFK